MMRAALWLCLLSVMSACSPPRPPAKTEFKGYAVGADISPERAIRDFSLTCVPPTELGRNLLCFGKTTMVDAPASIDLSINRAGRLTKIHVYGDAKDFTKVSAALREKFGNPSHSESQEEQQLLEWSRVDGTQVVAFGMSSQYWVDFNSKEEAARVDRDPAGKLRDL